MESPEVTRALIAALTERHDEFSRHYASACKKLGRETVHDLRTSCRRLIAALELFEELETPGKLNKTCKALTDLQHSLRDLRDLQVEEKRVSQESHDPAADEFVCTLKKGEKQEKRAARKCLQSFKAKLVKREIRRLVDFLDHAADVEPEFEEEIRELATNHLRERYQTLLTAAKKLPEKSPPPLLVHQVRIEFKHFRYAWELVARYLEHDAEMEKALKDFQTLLGKIQDLHVLLSSLVEFPRRELAPYKRDLARQQKQLIGRFQKTCPALLQSFRNPVSTGVQVRAT